MKILVIKHGALGDMINAMGAFSALRRSFAQAYIVLLTGAAYEKLAQQTGFFNEVIIDARSKNPLKLWKMWRMLKNRRFDWVFDLQNSARTAWYFFFIGKGTSTRWSGIAPGCSHPQRRPDRRKLHAFLRFADQLKIAGLDLKDHKELYPDMSWLKANLSRFNLPEKYIVVVPGSSKIGAYKRWTPQGYAELVQWISAQNIAPVLIGGREEEDVIRYIVSRAPKVIDLSSQTSFLEIGEIEKNALATVGNDTGAVHLAAAVKCPTLILWSKASSAEVFAPRGDHVHVLFKPEIQQLLTSEVLIELEALLGKYPRA